VKVLLVEPGPAFSVVDVCDGLEVGLRANGADVARLNLGDRLTFYSEAKIERDGVLAHAFSDSAAIMMAAKSIEVACYEFWPDVIVIVSGFFIPPELWAVLARRPHHVVLWCTESPYEDDRQGRPARYADTVVLNDPANLAQFIDEINPRTFYFPHSYDPVKHHPGVADPDLVCDFAFVGTGFESRMAFFEQVNWDGIDARFGGNWQQVADDSPLLPMLMHPRGECMDNVDAARLYRSAKVTANLYRKEASEGGHAHGWAMGPREVELAACGSFFLREPRGEGDDLFPMLPTFTTPAEFEAQLRWWLAHPAERAEAAEAARVAEEKRKAAEQAEAQRKEDARLRDKQHRKKVQCDAAAALAAGAAEIEVAFTSSGALTSAAPPATGGAAVVNTDATPTLDSATL
jgi:spore maturation protein CgeB